MAEGKFDLPDDLFSPRPAGFWAAEDDVNRRLDEEKDVTGFVDDTKDQVTLENSIPLSPQWLYAKPNESKVGLTTAVGDGRAPSFLPHGTYSNSIQKDGWSLDGSQEKKEWRRNAVDLESSRRWREEERETGLLCRKERKKEGERDNEYRKSDRRSDNIPIRESTDSRALPSDRWHEVPSRNLGHDNRRDNKWSSRWGPEDKEKDVWTEKKVDLDKEQPHYEKQSFIGSSRLVLESDSRDKWRPRHRQEVHTTGLAVNRVAPGFGVEKGRAEVSNVGFAFGRGRSNFIDGSAFSRSSSVHIGAPPVHKGGSLDGRSALSPNTFRYPRGKLLDIYRKQKTLSSFNYTPEGLEEVPLITNLSLTEPLAFVTPDTEEKALLEDVWKGKLLDIEVCNSHKESKAKVDGSETDVGGMPLMEMKHGTISSTNQESSVVKSAGFSAHINVMDSLNGSAVINAEDCRDIVSMVAEEAVCKASKVLRDDSDCSEKKITHVDSVKDLSYLKHAEFIKNTESEGNNSTNTFEFNTMLPDESSSFFGTYIPEIPRTYGQYHSNNDEVKALDKGTPEEWSLFYKDPQGVIQGPFPCVDIISWFEQGFFGVDLPVLLSHAPEGTPFQPLADVLPLFKGNTQPAPLTSADGKFEPSNAIRSNVGGCATTAECTRSSAICAFGFEVPNNNQVEPGIFEDEDYVDPNFRRLPSVNSELSSGASGPGRPCFHDISEHDNEEVLYTGRPKIRTGSSFKKAVNDLFRELPRLSSYLASEHAEANVPSHKVPTDNNLHSLGQLWSELEGAQSKRPLASSIGDQRNIIRQESVSSLGNLDAWSSSYRKNTSSNYFPDAIDSGHLSQSELDSNRFDIEEHHISQHLQKQQLQQQQLPSHQNIHMSRPFLEQVQGSLHHHYQHFSPSMSDLKHILKIQSQQEQLQQLHKQQHDYQEQQLRHHHMQLLHQQQDLQDQQLHQHQMQLLHQQNDQQEQQLQHHQMQFLRQQQDQQLRHDQMQFLHQQLCDPRKGDNMHDQVLLRQRVLHELQQQSHNLSRQHNPYLQQLIQSRFGGNVLVDQNNDLIDALSDPKNRQILPLKQEILLALQQEQLHARQVAMASRQQQLVIEEDRHGAIWSVDESGRFIRPAATPQQAYSPGCAQVNSVHWPQRSSSFEFANHLEQNFTLHEQMQQRLYEKNSQPYERSFPISSGTLNHDLVNTISHLRELDAHEHHRQMVFPDNNSQFPSGLYPHQLVSNQFNAAHADVMRGYLSESDVQIPNNLTEAHINQLRLESELQKRGIKDNILREDADTWVSHGGKIETKSGLADLLHQKLALQSPQLLGARDGVPPSSYGFREPSRPLSHPLLDHSRNILVDKVSTGESFAGGSCFPIVRPTQHEQLVNLDMEGHKGNQRMALGSSAAMVDSKKFLTDTDEIELNLHAPMERIVFSGVNEGNRMPPSKSLALSRSALHTVESRIGHGDSVMDLGVLKCDAPLRYPSFNTTGGGAVLYKHGAELDNGYVDEIHTDWTPETILESPDSSLLKHALDTNGLRLRCPDLASDLSDKVKKSQKELEGKQEANENLGFLDLEMSASGNSNMRYCQAAAFSGADTPETSFVDMLRSPKKTSDADIAFGAQESSYTSPGSKGVKKKGKKGRQIDPSLLGFKVSNRNVGEILPP